MKLSCKIFQILAHFWNTNRRTEINDCVTNSKIKNGKTCKNKYDSILGFSYSENMAKF